MPIAAKPSALHALHVALEIERRSHRLCGTAAQETADENGKQMYTWLAGAEISHSNLLMSNYESLVVTGGWI